MARESDGLMGHGSILLIATVIGGIANYFFHFYMIRALGPEDYGVLFSLLAILMIVGVPAGSIQTVITKYVSSFKAKEQNGEIAFLFFHSVKKLLFFGSLGLVIFIFFSGGLSTFLNIPSRIPVVIVGFVLLVFFLCPATLGTLQGLQRFTFLGLNIILGAILRVAFGIFLVYLGFSVNGALAASFFSGLIVFFIAFLPLSLLFKRERIDSSVETGEIYKFLIPTSLALASFNTLTYIDVPLVKHFFSPLEAGYYSTAAIVGKAFLFPPIALAGAMFPKVSEYSGKSRFLLNRTLLLSLLLLVFGILVCVLFPKLILTVLVKEKDLTPLAFSTIIPLLRLFGIAMSPFALSNILIYYNLACHRTQFLYFLLGGTCLQVILLSIFHASLLQIVFILGFSGLIIFILLFVLTLREDSLLEELP
jgi:O-antigen/teichoic acid export membrane protein